MDSYQIFNPQGWMAEFVAKGATLTKLVLNSTQTGVIDVVLAVPEARQGIETGPHFGVIAGRYANRIARGRFDLAGKRYQLQQNEGSTCLHGGPEGLHQKNWHVVAHDKHRLHLCCHSADGEAGFPGNLEVHVIYTWQACRLLLEITATTDQPTPLNLCQHHYFNLNGVQRTPFEPILNHLLKMPAEHYLAVDDLQIPTGEVLPVANSVMDFRQGRSLKQALVLDDPVLRKTQGLDHCFVTPPNGELLLESPLTGCRMRVTSDQPAYQIYTANSLGGTFGKYGVQYPQYGGICLEAQRYPDSPNHLHFPNCVLNPGERYEQTTAFEFEFDAPVTD